MLICINNAYPLLFLFTVLMFKPYWSIVLWFIAGLLWSLGHQLWNSNHFVDDDSRVIPKANLVGTIASIPTKTANKMQFQFEVSQLNDKPSQGLILLSCYNQCPDFDAGQSWRLTAKLSKPNHPGNPGGFDYATWLNARHIGWTGYVLQHSAQLIPALEKPDFILTLRQRMAGTLAKLDPDLKTLGVLQALTLGVTTHIEKSSWDLFRRTGTTHLIVISGSHIALVAGLIYGAIRWLWCRLGRLSLFYPAPKAASIVGLIAATFYTLLAGFEVPSQRSLIVCFFMFMRNFCSQRFGVWQSWRYALFAVIVFEPHSVLMPGFYLSFIAVGILLLINRRFSLGTVRQNLLVQLACLIGLMPLTLFWFSYGAINGFFANILAIPLVSFIIVPLGLFSALTGEWIHFSWLISILTHSITYLFNYLEWIDSFAYINLNFPVTQFLSPLALMIGISVFVLLPIPKLAPAIVLSGIAAFFPKHEQVKVGAVKLDIMDVGQGLAMVIRTKNHQLIYDTGAKFYQGSDMGQLVIIPYLQTLGIKSLDAIVISHPDLDHRGGLMSLEEKYRVKELIVDDPHFYKRGITCHDYPDWVWDGVRFHFFAIKKPLGSKNNTSCVLQVATEKNQVLLSGDIEKPAEHYLVETYRKRLTSSVLVIPHHGSKTSSSAAFIQEVSPRYAIASYGFNNRYHFPHQQAMEVYQKQQIPVYTTVDCGMISLTLDANSMNQEPSCYKNLRRSRFRRFFY